MIAPLILAAWMAHSGASDLPNVSQLLVPDPTTDEVLMFSHSPTPLLVIHADGSWECSRPVDAKDMAELRWNQNMIAIVIACGKKKHERP